MPGTSVSTSNASPTPSPQVLDAEAFAHWVPYFNGIDPEEVINQFPNEQAWEWMKNNIPFFECPDREMEKIYYFRWWTFRKHIKQTPAGRIITEFISPVRHAGLHNSISCALGFHIAEGRWIADQTLLDESRGFGLSPTKESRRHGFIGIAVGFTGRYLSAKVTGDFQFLISMLDDLVADYDAWETEKKITEGPMAGLYWQFDVWDGMEESITGSRKHKNARPTISSYMFANATAIAEIAKRAGRLDVVEIFLAKAEALKKLVQEKLWDADAEFFKAQFEEGPLSDAREAIDFTPWQFRLPDAGYESAWKQLTDEQGFWAPYGITTAERRHPKFRSRGVGQCEWDGAVWPFATSQTLDGLANILRYYEQSYVTKQDYFAAMNVYVKSQHYHGRPYIGEYLDETNGEWLKGENPRSLFYNHSTFNDLVIAGLVGIVPREDEEIEIDPLLPEGTWDYFCLDRVPYHGKRLTIIWDRDGKKYGRGAGLTILVDGKAVANRADLGKLKV